MSELSNKYWALLAYKFAELMKKNYRNDWTVAPLIYLGADEILNKINDILNNQEYIKKETLAELYKENFIVNQDMSKCYGGMANLKKNLRLLMDIILENINKLTLSKIKEAGVEVYDLIESQDIPVGALRLSDDELTRCQYNNLMNIRDVRYIYHGNTFLKDRLGENLFKTLLEIGKIADSPSSEKLTLYFKTEDYVFKKNNQLYAYKQKDETEPKTIKIEDLTGGKQYSKCLHCGKVFQTDGKVENWCSEEHRKISMEEREIKNATIVRNCKVCEREYKGLSNSFCSFYCKNIKSGKAYIKNCTSCKLTIVTSNKNLELCDSCSEFYSKKELTKACATCGKKFKTNYLNIYHCSKECQKKDTNNEALLDKYKDIIEK